MLVSESGSKVEKNDHLIRFVATCIFKIYLLDPNIFNRLMLDLRKNQL
jgi:hypothetical protein